MIDLDVFISGETIDLCVPTSVFSVESAWYSWFNDSKITRYLEHGSFPNTPAKQEQFFLKGKKNRLILIIRSKKNQYKGVVSLSSINLENKTCEIAIVIDSSVETRLSSYSALEAIALITEHGFKNMGMQRISAGQHIDLKGWQQRMELVGYKLEGIHDGKFIKGHEVAAIVSISCIYSDFLYLTKIRGSLWDGFEKMKLRISKLPARTFSEKLKEFYDSERADYYFKIFSL